MEYCKNIEEGFNIRLNDWYDNALRDYGVRGEGSCKVSLFGKHPCETPIYEITVNFQENGSPLKWVYQFCDEWRGDKNIINYLFDIWSETTEF